MPSDGAGRFSLWPTRLKPLQPAAMPMSPDAPRQTLLAELDARQDEVLAELESLNHRIEQVLREFTIIRPPAAESRAA